MSESTAVESDGVVSHRRNQVSFISWQAPRDGASRTCVPGVDLVEVVGEEELLLPEHAVITRSMLATAGPSRPLII